MKAKDVAIGKKYRLIKGGRSPLMGFTDGCIVSVHSNQGGYSEFEVHLLEGAICGFTNADNLRELTDMQITGTNARTKHKFVFGNEGMSRPNWEVSFLQEKPLTVCVLRNLRFLDWKWVGTAVCNKTDVWNSETGRRIALKHLVIKMDSIDKVMQTHGVINLVGNNGIETITKRIVNPIDIQMAYWKHYK